MAETESSKSVNESEIKIFYEPVDQNYATTPLIIKKLKNVHSQSIKVSITNKGEKNETRHNNVYENNISSNNNNNNNKQHENEIEHIQVNSEANKNTEVIEANNNNAINNNIMHMKSYTTPLLLNNQQFNFRYKDPKTGKLFSKILFDNNSIVATKSSGDDYLSNSGGQDTNRQQKMLTARSNKTSRTNLSGPVTISLYRSDTNLTKTKSITTERTYSFHDSSATPRIYDWKAKNERVPVKLAPDRPYINTYMDNYVNKTSSKSARTLNSAKINNIKFQGVSPFYGENKKDTDAIITTSQMFEHIFDMNAQFLNTYFPNSKKINSAKSSLSRSHTLPGHIALESAKNGKNYNSSYYTPSKRPLKFENPALYKSPKSALSTSRSTMSSITDATSVYDIDSIEIPILLKSPNSVNSYISYLKRKNNNSIFHSAKV